MSYKDKAAEIAYKNQYNREAYDRISICPSKEDGARIRAAAKDAGMSLQAYIIMAALKAGQQAE